MQDPHTPDFHAIHAIDDWGVRLYAIIGATMTLSATLERALFHLYHDASGLDPDRAARIFYRSVKFTHKRDVTERAVTKALRDKPLAAGWGPLLLEIKDLCGPSAARNLISHNPVESELLVKQDPETGDGDIYVRYSVPQNPMQVQVGNRRPQEEGYETLRIYAQNHFNCIRRVKIFTVRLREAVERSLPEDEPVLAAINRRGRTSASKRQIPPGE